ncbi:hypothetical protein C5167_005318 [Papaver somniferum]|uniref:S1-like domain-containing protein n=1 Tax=Papaver somniferum TaxID=3469 RepID=A0A4Y7JBV2_PAPSO|nr:hypothetical protein C5167_005318 [Papaver somniferum]
MAMFREGSDIVFIRIIPGDKVKIEVSRYDSTRGRIIYRLRNKIRMIRCFFDIILWGYNSRLKIPRDLFSSK